MEAVAIIEYEGVPAGLDLAGEGVRVGFQSDRVHQHQTGDMVGMGQGIQAGDAATHGVADQHHTRQMDGLDEVFKTLGLHIQVVARRRITGRLAPARQIRNHHVKPLGQLGRQRQPDRLVGAEAVQQHYGRAGTAFVVDPIGITGQHLLLVEMGLDGLAIIIGFQQQAGREQIAAAEHDQSQPGKHAQKFQAAEQHGFPQRSAGARACGRCDGIGHRWIQVSGSRFGRTGYRSAPKRVAKGADRSVSVLSVQGWLRCSRCSIACWVSG